MQERGTAGLNGSPQVTALKRTRPFKLAWGIDGWVVSATRSAPALLRSKPSSARRRTFAARLQGVAEA